MSEIVAWLNPRHFSPGHVCIVIPFFLSGINISTWAVSTVYRKLK